MSEPTTCQLNATERVILDEILGEREPSHWTAHRRQVASMCAKEMYRQQVAQEQLRRDGYVVADARGNRIANPLAKVADQSLRAVLAYRRSLAIHGRALGGEARDIARRHAIRLDQERSSPIDRDGLIACPGDDGGKDELVRKLARCS